MLVPRILQRLEDIQLLPELHHGLLDLAQRDEKWALGQAHWSTIIPRLTRLLGGQEEDTAPFATAWTFSHAALVHLDHLQDSDPTEVALPGDTKNAHYNLLFGYYLLATGLLDDLSPERIPHHRILHLRRFWTNMMLRLASGQQRDLTTSKTSIKADPLNIYQQLIQAKTGSSFALAFGGTAKLLTDNLEIINALIAIGEIFGMLLQCGDDVTDAEEQSNDTLTLPASYINYISEETGHTPRNFYRYIYQTYLSHVKNILSPHSELYQGVLELFVREFEPSDQK